MASTGTHATPPLIRTPTSVALTGLLSGGAVRILVKDKSDSGSVHVVPQRKNHYMAGTEASLQRLREMEAALAAEKDKENSFNASPSQKAPKDVSTAVVSTPKRPTTHVAVFTPPSSARKASGAKVATRALLSPGAATPTRAKAAATNKAVGMKTPPRSVAKGAAAAATAATTTVTPRRTAAAVLATHRAAAACVVTPRAQPPAAGSARIPAARSKSAPRAVPANSAAGASATAAPKQSAVAHKRPTQGVTTSPRPSTVPTPATAPATAVKKTVASGTTKAAATPGPRPSPSPRGTSLLPARTPGAAAKAGARVAAVGRPGQHLSRPRPQSAPRGSSSSLLRHHGSDRGGAGNGAGRGGGKAALVSISVIQVTCPAL